MPNVAPKYFNVYENDFAMFLTYFQIILLPIYLTF